MFGFQRLDAYKAAARFLGVASNLVTKIPRGNAALSDQLRRAALSVPLNIAEGSGKFSRDAVRFYSTDPVRLSWGFVSPDPLPRGRGRGDRRGSFRVV